MGLREQSEPAATIGVPPKLMTLEATSRKRCARPAQAKGATR